MVSFAASGLISASTIPAVQSRLRVIWCALCEHGWLKADRFIIYGQRDKLRASIIIIMKYQSDFLMYANF